MTTTQTNSSTIGSPTTTLLFIDSRLQIDHRNALPGTEIIAIDPDVNGIDLISATLAQYSSLQSIQLLGHGDEGRLSLGNVELNSQTLVEYAEPIQAWKASLTDDADILLFNCNVAAGELGQTFIQRLHELTDADIAASTDLTGQATAGGDWELEYQTGAIEAQPALSLETLATYDGVLIDVSTAAGLASAIGSGTSPINLTGNITLASSLPFITQNITINGNGYAIDGVDAYQLLTVNDGAQVTLRNLTLKNGLAQGGDTSGGGGGGLGAGGGLLVYNGSVVADAVTFSSNSAQGGRYSQGAQGGIGDGGGGYQSGGSGGRMNANGGAAIGDSPGGGGGGGGVAGGHGGSGGSGGFGAGGGAGGGGVGSDAGDLDFGKNGGSGGSGGFGGGGGAGGGGGSDYDAEGDGGEVGSGGSGGAGGTGGGAGTSGYSGQNSKSSYAPGGVGGGGAGYGGAVFVKAGSLTLINSSFSGNSTVGGVGSNPGEGKYSDIYVYGGTVQQVATSYTSSEVFGTIGALTKPSINLGAITMPTEGGTNGSIQLQLNNSFAANLPVSFSLGGTASSGDYTLKYSGQTLGSSVTIPTGLSSITLDVIATNDNDYDPSETLTLSLSSGSLYSLGSTTSKTLMIEDNEPLVSVVAGTQPKENGTNGQFTIALTKPAPQALLVPYTISGTATSGEDYKPLTGSVSFSAGEMSKTVTIEPLNDLLLDPAETITLSLTAATTKYSVDSTKSSEDLTIEDDEISPTAAISLVQVPIEGSKTAKFKIDLGGEFPVGNELSAGQTGTFFYYSITPGAATAGTGNTEDYTDPNNGKVFIASTQTSTEIELPITNDQYLEPNNETFSVKLEPHPTQSSLYVVGAAHTVNFTLTEDETQPTASLTLLQAPIEGSKTAKFRLNLTSGAVGNETFGGQAGTFYYYNINAGTATAGTGNTQDYTDPNSGKVFVPLGQTVIDVELPTTNDQYLEPDNETFSVKLATHPTQPSLYGINTSADTVNFTLTEDETSPTASISLEQAPIEGSNTAKFRINLTSGAVGNETLNSQAGTFIHYQLTAGTATLNTDFKDLNATAGTAFIPYGQTTTVVDIAIPDDLVYENPDETFSLKLLNHPVIAGTPDLYQVNTSNDTVDFTIGEDDILPTANLVKLNDPAEEGEVLGKFKISLAPEALTKDHATSVVTVGYEVLSGSNPASTGSDYAALSGSVTLAPGDLNSAEILINPVDDAIYDPDETITVRLKNPINNEPYQVGTTNQITFTLIENDHLYTVSLTPTSNANEVGTLGAFTLTLDQPAHANIVIDYTIATSGAIEGADYTPIARSVTIAKGQTTAAIQIQAQDNQIDEGDRVLTLNLAPQAPTKVIAPDNNYQANPSAQVAEIAIEDNDTAGIRVTALGNITNERGSQAPVEVRLATRPLEDVTVTLTSSNPDEGLMLAGGTPSPSASVTFTPSEWRTAKTLTVQGVDDLNADGDPVYSLTTSVTSDDPAYQALTSQTVSLKNLDDDGYGLLVDTPNQGTEGGNTSYTIALTQAPSEPIPVEIFADDQTLVSLDGTNFGQSAIVNLANINPATVYVQVMDDTDLEGLHSSTIEHRILDHNDPNYPKQTALTPALLSLIDNDSPIVNLIKAEAASEESVIAGRFAIAFDQPAPAGGITVNYTVTTSSATSGMDYRTLAGSVYVAEGSTGTDITVNPIQDSLVEAGGEFITVALNSSASYSLGSSTSKTVTIFDDDQAGVRLRQSGNTTQLREEVSGDSYTLELTSQPSQDVTIALNTSGEVVPSATSLKFTPANWNLPQTVSLPQVVDAIANGDRTQVITHSVTSLDASYSGLAVDPVNVKIIDNDIPGIKVSQSGFTTQAIENGANDSYTIVLESSPVNPVTIQLTNPGNAITKPFTGKDELALTPATLIFDSGNWNQPQTVTVTPVADYIDVENRVVDITHTVTSPDPNYNGFAIPKISVPITEDDQVEINITDPFTTAMTEGGASDGMTIVLNSQPTKNVVIDLTSPIHPITNPFTNKADIALDKTQLIFTPTNWNAPQTVTATVVNDDIDVENRTVPIAYTVTSSDPTYDQFPLATVNVNVTEDDQVGINITDPLTPAMTEGGASDQMTIVLNSQPIQNVVVDFTSPIHPITNAFTNKADIELDKTQLTFTPTNWKTPQTVTATVVNDQIDVDDHLETLTHAVSSGDPTYHQFPLVDAPVQITENDFVGLTIRGVGARNYVIEGSDNPDFFEVIVNSQPIADITIVFDTGTELEPIPDLVITPANWQTVFSIPFFAKQDTEFEATENTSLGFTVTSADPKYDPAGGLTDTIPAPAPLTIEVADRQLLGTEAAKGFGVVIDHFSELFEQNLRQQTFPILTGPTGELIDLSSQTAEQLVPNLFLFKDQLLADLAALGATDAVTAATTMTTAIQQSFAKAGLDAKLTVTPGVSLDEMTFDIGVNYSNPFETPLKSNLGLNDLKFDLDGKLKGKFDANLNLSVGWNERFGFFVDAQKTKLDTHFNVTPPPGFSANGHSGFLGGKATDDPQNPTKIDIDYDLSLKDLDDVDRIRFLDANHSGDWDAIEPLVEESNGTFPTLPVLGRFDLDQSGVYEASEGTILTTKKPDDGVRLTLTEIIDNASHADLANGTFSGIHNLGLNIDTAIPGLRDAPIPRFLFALDSDWEKLTYDTKTDRLAPLSQPPSINFQNFGIDVSSITDFILPIVDIIDPFLEPLNFLVDFFDIDIAPGIISKLFSLFDIHSIAGIDVDPFNVENFLKSIAGIDFNIGEFTAGLGDLGNLPSLVANLPTGFLNFGSFGISGPNLPKLDLNLPNLTFPRLPEVNLNLGALGLPKLDSSFDISQFSRSKSMEFPILTDPLQGLFLVLGKEDVTLATLQTPTFTGSGSLSTSTGIFQSVLDFIPDWIEKIMSGLGTFEANVGASFDVHAGMGFGFDILGLYKWAASDFDPEQADRILDGFFVSDREKPDGTGADIDELSFSMGTSLGLKAGSLLKVSGSGSLGGDFVVNLSDPNGDGKIRFYSEILPQLKYINRILSGHGAITASGSAKLEFEIKYPSIPDFWNLSTWSTTLFTINLPQTTLAKLSVSDSGVSFGTAFDGPMQGSTVFFDANFNGLRDRLEPSTTTFEEGGYNLDILLDLFDRNGDGKLDLTEGQIIVENGTDTDTFQRQRFPFLTAPEWTIASPLTALALRLAQPNLVETEQNLERAFALPRDFDLQNTDPFIAIENGDRNGVTVLTAQGQLQNLLILGANALQAKDDRNAAANAIMAQVSALVRGGTTLNLTDPAQVTSILNLAAQAIGVSADLSEIVTDIQTRNQAIVAASTQPLNEVRAAITDNVALEAIDPSYFVMAVEPWSVLLRTSQPVPPLDASRRQVIDLLDLPNIDFGTFDPFDNLGNRFGVEVLTRQIQLNATLTQIADIAIGAGVENAEPKVFDALVAALQSRVQLDDLSNPQIVLSLLQSVVSPNSASRMADIIAASNAKFTTIATTAIEANQFDTVRDQLVETQIVVQYLQSQLLQAVAAGKISMSQFDQLLELNQADPNMKTVIQNMIDGTDGNDTLIGTALNDWIAGHGGDDVLQGQAGDDQLYGNAGADQLVGDAGNDYLFGGADDDQLDGGEGDDLLDGGLGNDLLDGADGNDNLIGGLGLDSLRGNLGRDFITGGDDNDQLDGGEGDDYLIGDAGDDAIEGGLGNDLAIGGDGRDSLDGGDGDDILVGFADPDLLRGGVGNDLLFGNKGRDTLDGGEGDDSLSAGQKDDLVTGGVGNDYLFGNKDHDTLDGGYGDDVIYGGQQNDQLIGGEGNDTLSGDLGEDILIGQAGADVFQLRPSAGLDVIADFIAGEDSLELVGFSGEVTFADLVFSPIAGNTQLAIQGETIAIFNGVVSLTDQDVLGWSIVTP